MILRPVRIPDEAMDALKVLAFVTGKTYAALIADGVKALLSNPDLKARYETARKAIS